MWATIRRVDGPEAERLAKQNSLDLDDAEAFQFVAYRSDPTIAIFMGDDFLTMLGFLPFGPLSNTAYVWLQPGPSLSKYRIGFARVGRDIITEVRKHYPRLIGFCSAGSASERWWVGLGATLTSTALGPMKFVFEVDNDA